MPGISTATPNRRRDRRDDLADPYTPMGDVEVGLRVTDTDDATDTTHAPSSAGNSPPTVSRSRRRRSPDLAVDQTIAFTGTPTDPQDGTLAGVGVRSGPSTMEHCPSDCHSHIITSVLGREVRPAFERPTTSTRRTSS